MEELRVRVFLLKRKGITQGQIAEEIGISRPYLANILNERRNLSQEIEKKLLAVLEKYEQEE